LQMTAQDAAVVVTRKNRYCIIAKTRTYGAKVQIASEYANVSYITHVRVSHDFATPREGATQNKLLFDPKTDKAPEVFWRKFCKIPCSLPIEGQRHPGMNVLRNIQFIYSSTTHAHTHRTHASHTLTPHTHTHTRHTQTHSSHTHSHTRTHTYTHMPSRTHHHTHAPMYTKRTRHRG